MAVFDWLPKDISGGMFMIRSGAYTCPDPPRHERGGPSELTFRLLRDTRLSGMVRFPDGRPAPLVLVRAQGSPPNLGKSIVGARTGKDGSYNLDVPPERSYTLSIDDVTWAAPSLQNIVVREGQRQTGLDITLSKGTLVHGQVTEGPERRPSASAEVSLVEEGGLQPKSLRRGGSGTGQLTRRAITDSQGGYQFRVGPGRYWLMGRPSVAMNH